MPDTVVYGMIPIQINFLERGKKMKKLLALMLAVMMIVAGTFNGSARDVFGKAVKICTECIGLG